jgi:FERM/RhoGEF/pleckstrin domain protein 2
MPKKCIPLIFINFFASFVFPQYWLDLEKPVCRQVGLSLVDPLFRFCVKFYTPDPAQLEEEFTRYLFCLQIKRDLAQGLLQCNDNTAALMASYIVQGQFA